MHYQGPYALPEDQSYTLTHNDLENSSQKKNKSFEKAGLSLEIAPNPFFSSTSVNFSIPVYMELDIELRNHLGQIVQTLASSQQYQAGEHSLIISRNRLPAGVYYCILRSNNLQLVQKMMISQ